MSFRKALLDERRREITSLAGISTTEITPSRRDFRMFVSTQRSDLGLIPRIKRRDPVTGCDWSNVNLETFARACDEADVPAISVCTSAHYGAALDDLRRVSDAVTAPILCDDLCLDRSQVYRARLFGADAVVFPTAELAVGEIRMLADTASSMHMATVIEVQDEDHLERALGIEHACIGLDVPGADGWADIARAISLAALIPVRRTILLLSEIPSLDTAVLLCGRIDAAVVGNVLLNEADPGSRIALFREQLSPTWPE